VSESIDNQFTANRVRSNVVDAVFVFMMVPLAVLFAEDIWLTWSQDGLGVVAIAAHPAACLDGVAWSTCGPAGNEQQVRNSNARCYSCNR